VGEGDLYGFLGPNGAGKTTAIRCMLGLIRKDEGEVSLFGETSPVRQRSFVGALVETPAFHGGLSGWENLSLSAAYAGTPDPEPAIRESLERVGLLGREREPVRAYSLGMRQRLGIARALVGRPRILILDEPTNGLDPRGMKEVRDLLRGLARKDGLTVFVSSHLLGEVQLLCNRVGILEKGRLVYEGDVSGIGDRASDEALIVDVGSPDPVGLRAILAGVAGATVQGDGEAGRVRVALKGLDIPALNAALVAAGTRVEALVPVERNLEDLFLSMTSQEIT
jgi:ABC-2 type transport system ATP-binding protein